MRYIVNTDVAEGMTVLNIRRFFFCFGAILVFASATNASAQKSNKPAPPEDIQRCKEITPKQQLVLERRALGGDQRAQYVVAYCSWPIQLTDEDGKVIQKGFDKAATQAADPGKFRKRMLYAYKWSTLAYCDRQFNDLESQTKQLVKAGRIYERRLPAQDLRQEGPRQRAIEKEFLRQIRKDVNDEFFLFFSEDPTRASKEFVSLMEGLGANGLVTLALMRECPSFPTFSQKHSRSAIWGVARDEYADAFRLGETPDPGEIDLKYPNEYVSRLETNLSDEDKRIVGDFRKLYALYDLEKEIKILNDIAALGRMGDIPVQYLQLALGAFRKTTGFSKGIELNAFSIDNVYGEQTSKLVKQAQSNFCVIRDVAIREDALRDVTTRAPQGMGVGKLPKVTDPSDDCSTTGERSQAKTPAGTTDYPTGWLSALQARALICRAAVDRNDPYSYLHLAQMYANEFGYKRHYDKALFAVQRASRIFQLGPPNKRSNHKDLKGSALEKEYKRQAANLEKEIYKKAAKELLGQDAGDPPTQEVKNRINARVANANYDQVGNLCSDEVWRYWQRDPDKNWDYKKTASVSDADAAAGKTKTSSVDGANAPLSSVQTRLFSVSPSLPVSVSVDAPVLLNGSVATDPAPVTIERGEVQ